MNKADIPYLTATELSERIKDREVSPVEAVEAYLDRIEELNPKLNSYITVLADEAMEAARGAEEAIIAGRYIGPMHGIPVALKDQLLTRGILTTAGSNILRDFIPLEDATVVTKLRKAGAILLGKTNLTEFAITTNHHFPHGMMHNPWDLSRYAGSSSGGSASATAAFLCATSLGEDTGGSVRGPAASCGLAGFRPSYGLVSRYGLLGACWSKDVIGPMSRTVADCAMTLQAIAGHDPRDRYTWDMPVPDYTEGLNGNIGGLRVGVVIERVHTDDVIPEIRTAVVKAIEVLGELGASIQEISLPMIAQTAAFSLVGELVEAAAIHQQYIKERLDEYQNELRLTMLMASLIPAQTYYKCLQLREVWRNQMLSAFDTVDIMVYPTSPSVAPTVPPPTGLASRADMKENFFARRSFTHPASLAGCPALSVNCGFTDAGLPMGLQIIGRPFEDKTVLKVGHAYEQATEWHKRRPPI
ncbi:MAG: amidase [Dehalococcoidia bacterium]